MKRISLWGIIIVGLALNGLGQDMNSYQNPSWPVEKRVADLMARMSPEEKFRQLFMVAGDLGSDSTLFLQGLFGFQINTTPAVGASDQILNYSAGPNAKKTLDKINGIQRFFVEETRLGIPMIAFDEALHGLVRKDATSFPQSIALAAAFDTTLMRKVSMAIGKETKARGLRMVLSPVLNLATDVRWGRVEETYGEDPLLASLYGRVYVSSMENMGIITTPKHFVLNHGDGGRDSYPAFASARLLHEFYFKPFRDVVQRAGARSIMTAYNSLDGRPCTANSYLLKDVLRDQWGFRGFVISDAAATGGANVLHFTASDYEDAGKQSIENGLDVIFQSDFSSYPLFDDPFLNGSVDQTAIDSALVHVLRMKFELGLFDDPYVSDELLNSIDLKANSDIAYEAAIKSIVLLKNENEILPLSKSIRKLAVIGPDAVESRLGGYSGPGNQPVSIFDGLKKELPDVELLYAEGCGRSDEKYVVVPAKNLFRRTSTGILPGVNAHYHPTASLQTNLVLEKTDSEINFQWTLFGPDPMIPYDHFAVEWEGIIVPDESGKAMIGIEGNDGYKLFLNGKVFIDRSMGQSYETTVLPFSFKKGEAVDLRIEYIERRGNARVKLIWNLGYDYTADQKITEAIKRARSSDLVVVVAGIEEGEFRDRSDLRLPGRQEELILRLAETGKPIVVILSGGSAITMESWIDKVDAIVDIWYPGEKGGVALAAVLSGSENPSGRLPITFPRSVGQVPLVYNHFPTGRGDDYLDGTGHALFPFGFGLSYTQFEYSHLKLSSNQFRGDEKVKISFWVKNTGSFTGEEVVQLYVKDEIASIARPVKELKGFTRIKLNPGEEKEVSFEVSSEDFLFPDENMKDIIEPGSFRIMIGASSKDIRLRTFVDYVK